MSIGVGPTVHLPSMIDYAIVAKIDLSNVVLGNMWFHSSGGLVRLCQSFGVFTHPIHRFVWLSNLKLELKR